MSHSINVFMDEDTFVWAWECETCNVGPFWCGNYGHAVDASLIHEATTCVPWCAITGEHTECMDMEEIEEMKLRSRDYDAWSRL